jgi:hypothetical protein
MKRSVKGKNNRKVDPMTEKANDIISYENLEGFISLP